MKKIQYSEILKQSFGLTWKNKFLWILGFFVLLGSAFSNVNYRENSIGKDGQAITYASSHPLIMVIVFIVLITIFLAAFVLKTLSIAAIIKSVKNPAVYSQQKIKLILSEMTPYFWRLVGLQFLIGSALLAIVFVLAMPIILLYSLKATTFAISVSILAFIILIPFLVLVFLIQKYASMYLILSNSKIKESINFAYSVLQKNIKESLIMILVSISQHILFAVGVALAILSVIVSLAPFALLAYLVFKKIGLVVIGIIGVVVAVLLVLFIFSFFNAYLWAIWVGFFSKISMIGISDDSQNKEEIMDKVPNPEVA